MRNTTPESSKQQHDTHYQSNEERFYANRSPLIAALMSASLPGFGQLYNGQINKAAWIFIIFAVVTIPVSAAIALWLPVPWTLPLLLTGGAFAITVWLYAIVNAWTTARHNKKYLLRPWQSSSLYTLVFIICNLIALPVLAMSVRNHLVQPFSIPSNSMLPTVVKGDYLFAKMGYNCPGCPDRVDRGDIAILINPNNRNMFYIKRVIGLPGDSIEITDNQLSINGQLVQHNTSQQPQGNTHRVTEQFGDRYWQVQWQSEKAHNVTATVKPGHVYVLGDNRAQSIDSRYIGQIPLSDLKGLARQIWFSRSKDGIKWNRIGLDLTTR